VGLVNDVCSQPWKGHQSDEEWGCLEIYAPAPSERGRLGVFRALVVSRPLSLRRVVRLSKRISGVDPTRLELVTSAMRERPDTFAGVRGRSEKRLGKPD
jgi:hypothetical protein